MKPTREEVLKLMRQASGGILTQVAEDPRCGYEIKVEELQTFAELLQVAKPNSDHVAVIGAKKDSVHLAVISAEPEPRLTAAQIAEIASWLDEASDDIDSWGGYASDYFAEKWNLSGTIQSYKDRATKVRELLVAQSGISSLDRRPNEKKEGGA